MWMSLCLMMTASPTLAREGQPANACNLAMPATLTQICWQNDLAASYDQARMNHKHILVDVYTDWCGWCKRLDRDTYSDPGVVQRLSNEFICVKVNAEDAKQGRQFARTHGVNGFPCIMVLDPDGKVIGQFYGYRRPQDFLSEVNKIVDVTKTQSQCKPSPLQRGHVCSARALEQAQAMQMRRAEPLSNNEQGPNNFVLATKLVSEAVSYLHLQAPAEGLPSSDHCADQVVENTSKLGAGSEQSVTTAQAQRPGTRLYGRITAEKVSARKPAWLDVDALISGPYITSLPNAPMDPAEEPVYRCKLAEAEERAAKDPNSSRLVAEAANRLAYLCAVQGQLSEAERLYKRALEVHDVPERTCDSAKRLNTYLHNLAVVYCMEGKFAEGEWFCSHVLAERTGDNDPCAVDSLWNSAWCIGDLAMLYHGEQDYPRAEKLYKNSLAIFEALVGSDSDYPDRHLKKLALLYEEQGRYREAEELHLRRLMAAQKWTRQKDDPFLVSVLEDCKRLAGRAE